ncbi:cytochrome c biogenesis protein DipZ [Candidatus Dojkabacteria bacterium]|uniref:Cytochrome c biogenesis protein DipZ n=1 Tax=Candidatus Dojkabacteria bacterium TaxID=2099670 RepID=A0A955L4P1_9BACT|nr:cytochrome c biogenesis protein DipZ [Candidatus Dojkabacteria bacterium]
MEYLLISFIAGVLTVIAPCVFTLLPVVLSGSLQTNSWKRPLIIIGSLSSSVFLFTLLLKASTALISVPPEFWTYLSGGILIIFGIFTIFPDIWTAISTKLGLSQNSEEALHKASQKQGVARDIMIGLALGPVFSSCSPTYAIIIATVLPQSFWIGVLNLLLYVIGLALVLSIIAVFGQKAVAKMKWAANPNSVFKKILGAILVIVGIFISTGLDKDLETFLLDNGLFDPTNIEINLMKMNDADTHGMEGDLGLSIEEPYDAPEIQDIEAWINSDGEKIADLKGKVVLIDFWTYSCINCVRTIPYVQGWYEKYQDDGLVVIGMHAPEFAFERELENVENAVSEFGITYPVGLDNNYGTWRAYDNQFWPAHYFIDKNGQIVHTHFGVGEYDKSEAVIRYLLELDTDTVENSDVEPPISSKQTPETYLGYQRGQYFANAAEFIADQSVEYAGTETLVRNYWSLSGAWIITDESSISNSDNSVLRINYSAKDVYLVMGSDEVSTVKVILEDGDMYGTDVYEDGTVRVDGPGLYHLISNDELQTEHILELQFEKGIEINAFTFGS